jgi:hypothetical protein
MRTYAWTFFAPLDFLAAFSAFAFARWPALRVP